MRRAAIGIDIEAFAQLPDCDDYANHAFYTSTFTAREIICSLSTPDAKASFAERFAAKEAIVKADERFIGRRFSSIELLADADGELSFSGFALSVAHAADVAVAVALRIEEDDIPC